MRQRFKAFLLASALWVPAGGAAAQPPEVAASIKPIHSLVAAVMEGVGEPLLIVGSTGSEHVYAMRPSDAGSLQEAELVFWVGHELETFLEKPLETLASGAEVIALSDTPGLTLLPFREGGPFEPHAADALHEDDHGHEEHGQEGNHGSEAQNGGHAADDGHGHDMHVWLDPANARLLVERIAEALSGADPENAARYRQNAEAYAKRLEELSAEIDAGLAPVRGKSYVVFHDAYQYFERRFDIPAAGSITVSPEIAPGVQRLAEIKAKVEELGAACVFSEPQFEPSLVGVVTEGTEARTGVLDPLGAAIEDGPELYPTLMRNMAASLKACLADAS